MYEFHTQLYISIITSLLIRLYEVDMNFVCRLHKSDIHIIKFYFLWIHNLEFFLKSSIILDNNFHI
jgi:hypothetical protein